MQRRRTFQWRGLRPGPLSGIAVAISLIAIMALMGCGTPTSAAFSGSPGSASGTPTAGGGSGNAGSGNSTTASAVKGVSVTPTSIAAGTTSSATVTLDAAAPAGGANITLTSSNASVASVPTSVLIAAGQTSTAFAVATGAVPSDTTVSITAAYNNTFAGVTVSVKAPVAQAPSATVSISLSPSSAALVAGTTQQFTAAVTGTASTGVSWTATGGSVTSTGLFTAPNVSTSTIVTVQATSQAAPSVFKTAQVTVTPAAAPPPSGGAYSGAGPVALWQAYQYRDTDGLYHQAIRITNSQGAYPVIGYSYSNSSCVNYRDTFNDFWQPIANGLWWFTNWPDLVYVRWVWYNNSTDKQILQQTPCIDHSSAPLYN